METPPRAWGRLDVIRGNEICHGNTPTGVGKTSVDGENVVLREKHPHGRGEDRPPSTLTGKSQETPPRAWGRLMPGEHYGDYVRNTPTGVGKTISRQGGACTKQKHPHGRGEDRPGSEAGS